MVLAVGPAGDRLGQGTHEPREAGEPPADRRHERRIGTQHRDCLLQWVYRFLDRWHGWSVRQYRSSLFRRWTRKNGLSRGIRLGRHAAWEERQPPPSDLLIGPEGDHIRTVAENHMEVVRHVRVSRMPLLIHLVQRRHVGLS